MRYLSIVGMLMAAMDVLDVSILFILSVLVYFGAYQPYFFFQRFTTKRMKELSGILVKYDSKIPLLPIWVWMYTVFYYPVVVVVVTLGSTDHRRFIYIAFSYVMMLSVMVIFYLVYPVTTPPSWRQFDKTKSISHRFLAFTQSIDGPNNCFPSGHAAISVITAYHMIKFIGTPLSAAYSLLVILSCLFCKQHYIVDVLAGVMVGFFIIWVYTLVI